MMFLDNNLNDTFLRFSSWHQMETKYNQVGDFYYDDCAYIEIEYSPVGQFTGEELSEPLMINFLESSGVGPSAGLYAKDDSGANRDRISPECNALENNFFGLAGTSTNPQNSRWLVNNCCQSCTISRQLHQNQVSFYFHADAPGNIVQSDKSGWYIDDVTIGEKYAPDGTMVIENLQSTTNYDEKSPNGYGLLFLDTFEPADSRLTYTIRNAITGLITTDDDGNAFEDLTRSSYRTMGFRCNKYPYIDLEVNFDSGNEQISTPIFYGYTFGTEMGLTFNDLKRVRDLSVSDGEFDYIHDKGIEIYINSSTFLDTEYGDFSKPIYGLNVTGVKQCVSFSMELSSPMYSNPLFSLQTWNNFEYSNF